MSFRPERFVKYFLNHEGKNNFTTLGGVTTTMETIDDRVVNPVTMSMIYMLIVAGFLASGAEDLTSVLVSSAIGMIYFPLLMGGFLVIPVAVALDMAGSKLAKVVVSAGLATLPSPPPPPPQPVQLPSHGVRKGDKCNSTKPRRRTGNRSSSGRSSGSRAFGGMRGVARS